MPYFTTSEEWQRQSTLLLQARPTTTRITTKYHIPNLSSPRHEKKLSKRSQKSKDAAAAQTATDGTTAKTARAYLELKTYDPESGTSLKYKTTKAAEVGRLIGNLGRLGRPMAGLEVKEEDVEMKDAKEVAGVEGSGTATPSQQAEPGLPIGEASAVQQKAAQQGGAPGGGGGGGGKKKKKKGKR